MERKNDDIRSSLNPLTNDEEACDNKNNKSNKLFNKKNIIIMASFLTIIIILLISILIIVLSDSSSNSSRKRNKIGEINCLYNIESNTEETLILSKNFKKTSDFDILIDDEKVDYSISKKLEIGEHKISYILYNDINMLYMFQDIQSLIRVNMTSEKRAKILDIRSSFENCKNLIDFHLEGFDLKETKSFHKLFYNSGLITYNISGDISKIEDISYMFSGTDIESININDLLKDNILNASHLFDNCQNLKSIELSEIQTSNIKDISYMFYFCESLINLDLTNFVTNNVLNMSHLFDNCISISNLKIQNFETYKVLDMSYMFNDCHSLKDINLSNFRTDNVKNMSHMFCNCNSLQELNIFNFMTNNVEDMSHMFDSKYF